MFIFSPKPFQDEAILKGQRLCTHYSCMEPILLDSVFKEAPRIAGMAEELETACYNPPTLRPVVEVVVDQEEEEDMMEVVDETLVEDEPVIFYQGGRDEEEEDSSAGASSPEHKPNGHVADGKECGQL